LSFPPDTPQQGSRRMHVSGAFELDIRPGTPDNPASVRIALLRYARGEDGRLLITPECASFEEVEGQINSLQDELDEIRDEPGEPSRLPDTMRVVPPRGAQKPHRTNKA
jgi:hypothetical protein